MQTNSFIFTLHYKASKQKIGLNYLQGAKHFYIYIKFWAIRILFNNLET